MHGEERPIAQDSWSPRVFCAVAEQGSVTQPARRLDMSQPGVSMAIRRLEQRYRG